MDGFFKDAIEIECRAGDAVGHGVKEVLLSPDGEVRSKSGHFIMDQAGAESIIADFKSHGVDVVVDIDHTTLRTNSPAPAAGWIKDLFYQPERGLLALVLWNDRAREMIRAGEYAYISPVLMVRKSDRRAVSLHSAAVTNKPAIPQMERVAASEVPTGSEVDGDVSTVIGRISELLDLDLTATASPMEVLTRVLEALRERKGQAHSESSDVQANAASPEDEALLAIGKRLKAKGVEFPEKPTRLDVLQAVLKALEGENQAPDEDEATPSENAEMVALQVELNRTGDELASMKEREAEREVEERIQPHVASNKLNPRNEAVMASARKLAQDDPDTFETLMAGIAPYAEPGLTKPPPHGPGGPKQARQVVIRNAVREFQAAEDLDGITDLDAFTNLALRDAELPKLSEDELATFV